jgi:pyridoxamine 5'-phosphate oxidase
MDTDLFSSTPLLSQASDPLELFDLWLNEAKQAEVNDPEAMALATCDEHAFPDVRMVLLKGYDLRGFVFYSNENSAKGLELRSHGHAALLFHWKSLRRQVRIRGSVIPVSEEEADSYFASRSRESQLSAWASRQSEHLEQRQELGERYSYYTHLFEGNSVPRPPYWIGFRVAPLAIEFWLDRAFRLHERLRFLRCSVHESWDSTYLYP